MVFVFYRENQLIWGPVTGSDYDCWAVREVESLFKKKNITGYEIRRIEDNTAEDIIEILIDRLDKLETTVDYIDRNYESRD
jgi:hypothetical protein